MEGITDIQPDKDRGKTMCPSIERCGGIKIIKIILKHVNILKVVLFINKENHKSPIYVLPYCLKFPPKSTEFMKPVK